MATSTLQGVNYELGENIINFFGAKGIKFDGDKWGINDVLGAIWFQVDPDTMMPRIAECIAGDVADGNGDKVAQLQLGARQAVVFYLEGKLTREHLKHAIEGADFIDIPNVDVDGRILTVRVQANPEHSIATADSEGNVL
jgi:hypothetical protein